MNYELTLVGLLVVVWLIGIAYYTRKTKYSKEYYKDLGTALRAKVLNVMITRIKKKIETAARYGDSVIELAVHKDEEPAYRRKDLVAKLYKIYSHRVGITPTEPVPEVWYSRVNDPSWRRLIE